MKQHGHKAIPRGSTPRSSPEYPDHLRDLTHWLLARDWSTGRRSFVVRWVRWVRCSHHVAYVGCKTPASLGIMIIMIFRYMFMKPNQPKLNQDITCKVVFKHQESWFQSPVSLGGFPHRQAITSLLALFQLGLFSILLASTVKHASCSAGKCPNLLRDFTPWNVGFREDTGLLPLV